MPYHVVTLLPSPQELCCGEEEVEGPWSEVRSEWWNATATATIIQSHLIARQMSVGLSVWRGDKGWSLARNTLQETSLLGTDLSAGDHSPSIQSDSIQLNADDRGCHAPTETAGECCCLASPSPVQQQPRRSAYQGPLSALIIVMVKSCVIQDIHDRSSSSYRSL